MKLVERVWCKSIVNDRFWQLIGGLTVVRFAYIGFAPVTAQEVYYWLYAQNLAVSYVDHPPMIAYSIYLGTFLFGDTGFGIKFMAVVWSLLTNVLLYITACRVFGTKVDAESKSIALLAVLIYNLTLFSHIFAVIQQPDSGLLFFWLSVIYFIQEVRNSGQNRNFIFAGVALGFALLCKYSAIAIVPGLFLALLLDRKLRRSMLTVYPYLALLIAFLVFSPVLAWNANNEWISFRMQFGHRATSALGGNIFHYKYILQLLGTQLAMLTPLVFVLLIKTCVTMIRNWRKNSIVQLHFLSGAVLIAGFTLISVTSKVKMHWLLPGYLGVIVAIAVILNRPVFEPKTWFRKGAVFSLILIVSGYILFLVPGFQIFQINSWSGWQRFSGQVIQLQEKLGGQDKVFIFTDSHKTAAYVTFYAPDHQRTYAQNIIGGFAKQLTKWGVPDALDGMNGLYISTRPKFTEAETFLLDAHFEEVEQIATFSYPLLSVGDKPTREIYCFLAKNYRKTKRIGYP